MSFVTSSFVIGRQPRLRLRTRLRLRRGWTSRRDARGSLEPARCGNCQVALPALVVQLQRADRGRTLPASSGRDAGVALTTRAPAGIARTIRVATRTARGPEAGLGIAQTDCLGRRIPPRRPLRSRNTLRRFRHISGQVYASEPPSQPPGPTATLSSPSV